MNQLKKYLAFSVLSLATSFSQASPLYLITHNRTNLESNAFIAGKPSLHPTSANSDGRVSWVAVRMACYGKTDPTNHCYAIVKMATNTLNPIELGSVSVNLDTGNIEPKQLSKNGYILIVNGPGESTIIKAG